MPSPSYVAVIGSWPMILAENPIEHVPLPVSVQLPEPPNVPALLGETLQVTLPVGVPTVPIVLASVTVAVHVVDTPTSVGFGAQVTLVLESRCTARLAVPTLGKCVASPV